MTYEYNGHEETESGQTHCDVHRPEISWCQIAREDGSYTALVSSANSDVLQSDLRCTCRIPDQLIEADCSTSFEMALCIIANPSDIETRCDIETHGDNKEGKVSPSHSWYSREQNITYVVSRDEPFFGTGHVPMRLRDMPRTINGLLIWYLSLK
jgi:hypothetical protein